MKISQSEEIIHHLKLGHTITALEALDRFGCLNLKARINELRNDHIINTKMIKTRTGKTIAEYSLGEQQVALDL